MEMNINEKKALYAFGCPVLKATVERLRMLAAITPDPGTKKLFYKLAIKLLGEGVEDWYRCFFYNLRIEMENYFNAPAHYAFGRGQHHRSGGLRL